MTRKEKEQVKKAIDLLMDDGGGFEEGIHILCSLVGWKYPVYDVIKTAKPITLQEYLHRHGNKH